MAFLHRGIGKFMKRSADDADVATIIADVKSYEERLDKLIDGLQRWQESINQLLRHQTAIPNELFQLYKPIPPERVAIDQGSLERIEEWSKVAADMKEELSDQAAGVGRVLKQATSVRDSLKPVKKVLAKRENCKLDYERYTSSAESARKKGSRTEREAGTLAKAERQLEQATNAYHGIDHHIKEYVPPILDAILSYIPYVLYAVENLYSTFIGQKYRFVHEFAQRHSIANYDQFEEEWKRDFFPVKDNIESFKLLQHGKAISKPMETHRPPPPASTKSGRWGRRNSSKSGEEIGGALKKSKDEPPPYSEQEQSRPMARKQSTGLEIPTDSKFAASRPVSRRSSSNLWPPSEKSAETPAATRPGISKIPSATSIKSQQNSAPPPYQNGLKDRASSASLAAAAAAAAKKKPPPPVPKPKPQILKTRVEYMVALYRFEPQSDGDLPLSEGDRVKIIQKSDSTEDWWEGECVQSNGTVRRGFFPANYCQME
ncbi:hypothetical protein DRE_02670 [Drechslerella stenobrocha 248]|uniref:SH3 domain-containing protein n=1 Tax=Drechslerella stenobrocha 248 TaxID=1043628 RepID=W7HV85_9PEZI|nr:hypothetical protein DRE_02670 [Drechslerella stenobrocha 248]